MSSSFEYHNDDKKTAASHREGLFTVGDAGYLDADGYLYLTDRKSDMVISGGVNIYPREIEDVLHRHPEIVDCAVLGLPDDQWGEVLYAVVQPAPSASLDEDAVVDLRARAPRRLQAAPGRRVRRRATAGPERQGAQAQAPRSPAGAPRQVTGSDGGGGGASWASPPPPMGLRRRLLTQPPSPPRVASTGSVSKLHTTPLMTMDEAVEVMKKAGSVSHTPPK